MLKFIHSKNLIEGDAGFELDLSDRQVSTVEENNWFSDRFVSKYTFPIKIELTSELNRYFGDILDPNSKSVETYFEGDFYYNGKVFEAVLELEDKEGHEVSVNIRFGLDEIPNFDKKLRDLPLEEVDLSGTDIYTHAETKITQSFPDTNYNFVMVHSNNYFDISEEQWASFEGFINKRTGGAFVQNYYDGGSDTQHNLNAMIPQPYLMHVIKTAIEDAGYTFAGTFQDHPKWKHALFSELSKYYTEINLEESQEWLVLYNEFDSTYNITGNTHGYYTKSKT